MATDRHVGLSAKERALLIHEFLDTHPEAEIQDLYKWLYLGEFGEPEKNMFYSGTKALPELHLLLAEIKRETTYAEPCKKLWEPIGIAARFVKVFLTPYYLRECPLNRLVNLMERSPAFRGGRMEFKLDWNYLKEKAMVIRPDWDKEQFQKFEEENNFHQLPDLPHTELFLTVQPYAYRVVSQKLFFSYYPEYEDDSIFHPFDSSASFIG